MCWFDLRAELLLLLLLAPKSIVSGGALAIWPKIRWVKETLMHLNKYKSKLT